MSYNEPATRRQASILEAVYETIDEANEQQPLDRKLAKSPATVLLGEAGALDSVGLINFIIVLEQNIAERFDLRVSLTADPGLYGAESPLRTVRLLVQYLESVLDQTVGN